VRGVDAHSPSTGLVARWPEYGTALPGRDYDEFRGDDLRYNGAALRAVIGCEWVFALAANMGGIGHIISEQVDVMRDNTLIDTFTIEAAKRAGIERLLYASSACVYPDELQRDDCAGLGLRETDVYPASPGTAYGWEKLHAEHLCRQYRLAGWVDCRISRMHTVYGPGNEWRGMRAKVVPALCRKVAIAKFTGGRELEIWGDGEQRRSFTYIDDCLEGLLRQMGADAAPLLNLGHAQDVSINELADMIMALADVQLTKRHIAGPEGVRCRASDNSLIRATLGWEPTIGLDAGLPPTYAWIEEQVKASLERSELL